MFLRSINAKPQSKALPKHSVAKDEISEGSELHETIDKITTRTRQRVEPIYQQKPKLLSAESDTKQ